MGGDDRNCCDIYRNRVDEVDMNTKERQDYREVRTRIAFLKSVLRTNPEPEIKQELEELQNGLHNR